MKLGGTEAFGSKAMARTTVVAAMFTGPAYKVDVAVGVVPSKV